MDANHILVINPGATSTKIAVYRDNRSVFMKTIRHEYGDLDAFSQTTDQLDYRRKLVFKRHRQPYGHNSQPGCRNEKEIRNY